MIRHGELKDYFRGWFIGDFEPSILRTEDFEVGVLTHKAGEEWPSHYHAIATEYNVLLKGTMLVNGKLIEESQIFSIEPCETSRVEFLDDCTILVIKTPSIPGDKYIV
jgi:quercetin dioxygenase-like cupin family protein